MESLKVSGVAEAGHAAENLIQTSFPRWLATGASGPESQWPPCFQPFDPTNTFLGNRGNYPLASNGLFRVTKAR